MSNKIQVRRGTSAQGNLCVLDAGELGYDTDTKILRIGDGVTAGGTKIDQTDTVTLFIPAGITYSPVTYAGRNRTYSKIFINCQGENPTSLVVTLYHNGTVIYTSPAITTNETIATVNLAITADQTIYALVSNTTGLTKGVSISIKQGNR